MRDANCSSIKFRDRARLFEPPVCDVSSRGTHMTKCWSTLVAARIRLLDQPALSRRLILSGLAGALAFPQALAAQTTGKLPRVGYVQADSPFSVPMREAFLAGLRELGWVDGQNVALDWRRRDDEMAELVRLNVDVLVLSNPYRVRAGLKLTRTIPIVANDFESDPVAAGFVKSLARPGGNVTGIWVDLPELAGKQLQFLTEAVPRVRRVAIIWDDRIGGLQFTATEAAARTVGVTVHSAPLREPREVENMIAAVLPARPQAALLLTSPVVFRVQGRLAALLLERRLGTICGFTSFPDNGGLLSYGPNQPAINRQMASYVDRILKGARAGDLPVERPAKFELRVNARTAKVLGLTLPPSLLARADEVLQ
jgi:putative ABC transport system substrate-binding protein